MLGEALRELLLLRTHRAAPVVPRHQVTALDVDAGEIGVEARELFTSRQDAEAIVQAWDRDEPEQVGELQVEEIELETAQPRRTAPALVASVAARDAPGPSRRSVLPRVPQFAGRDHLAAASTSDHAGLRQKNVDPLESVGVLALLTDSGELIGRLSAGRAVQRAAKP
jgi:hypothetical protein